MTAPEPQRRIAIVTGTRAEFGLLRSTIDAVIAHRALTLQLCVAGMHFLPPSETVHEVEAAYDVTARVPMQQPGATGRLADAAALGRGVAGFAEAFAAHQPDIVVVLGDRIEAFAAAGAASVGGIVVAHIHGGDRAEGVADEAMRHAITKLAHLHFPATQASADRIRKMGERPEHVHVVGSPAIDGLDAMPPLTDDDLKQLGLHAGPPRFAVLHHPAGLADAEEERTASTIRSAVGQVTTVGQAVYLEPNADPGRDALIAGFGAPAFIQSLPRPVFIGLLRRIAQDGGALIGNSSAGLIEAAAVGARAITIGPRQRGRERGSNVMTVAESSPLDVAELVDAIALASAPTPTAADHPYGDGRAGQRIAAVLSEVDELPELLRKHNTY
jgi:UDP-hydrolysing UDP-N-acetyl-D-glucosamine 2-epimerase